MKILVVGASGLVGNSVCREFLSNNFNVTGLVYKTSALIDHINYKEISINLISESLSVISNKFDLVIHCAAIIPNGNLSDEELFINNQSIDMNVFVFCETNNIRLIYFSTVFFTMKKIQAQLTKIVRFVKIYQGIICQKEKVRII